jgi:protein-disulfide isomerase
LAKIRSFTFGDFATAVLVVCAVVITGLAVHRHFSGPQPMRSPLPLSVEERWESFAASGRIYGIADAPVTIVEFGDYECPACRVFHGFVDSLLSIGKSFRVVHRHFPLAGHRFAIPAARASECAANQGNFERMHQILYKHADSLGLVPWWWYAQAADVRDSAKFERCLRSASPGGALAADTVAGQKLGVLSTPTLLIGRLRVNGVPPFDSLSAYIDRATRTQR